MVQQVLKIHWTYGTEYVPLGSITEQSATIRTTERWKHGGAVMSYVATVQELTHRRRVNTLRLHYETKMQDPGVRKVCLSGETTITWEKDGSLGKAAWVDDDDPHQNETGIKVTVLGGHRAVTRLIKSVSVIMRPDQRKLREALVSFESCALTGEAEENALDAAHIVPVKAGGRENIENAFLLRADLHRLFDAGLFWFQLSKNSAVVKCAPSLLSGNYASLHGKKLPDATFVRVASALRDRAKLPMNTSALR